MAEAAQPAIPGEYPPLHGGKLFFLTVAIATASFMEILDMTIVNVSVPSISGSLGVTPSEGTWAVSSYMLAAAIMQPLSGWIARRFGEVRTFVTSIMLFMVFSAVCGVANSLPMLVVARLIQGFVSGPMMSVAQAILLRNYPIEKRGMALGLWSMVIMVAPIFGPIIGGWITDNYSWPWLFYINLPVGAFSAIASWSIESNRQPRPWHYGMSNIELSGHRTFRGEAQWQISREFSDGERQRIRPVGDRTTVESLQAHQ